MRVKARVRVDSNGKGEVDGKGVGGRVRVRAPICLMMRAFY